MRVVHVVVSDAYAGVEAHVSRLAREQAARGYDVVIVGGRTDEVQRVAGSAVTVLAGRRIAESTRRLVWLRPRREIVHAHMTAAELASVLYLGTRRRQVPLVVTRHFGLVRGRSPAGRIAARVIRSRVTRQIAVSQYVAGLMDGPGVVVHPGVEIRPDARPVAERRRTVLMVQRLESEKRTERGILAFAKSGLGERGWRLEVAGDGAQRPSLAALVNSLGVSDSVDFLGHRSDVAELMASAAILLAPCNMEGLGLSVLEAMAAGLPVVAAAAGGHRELLDGLDGRGQYPPDDDNAAATNLAALASDASGRDRYALAEQTRQRNDFTMEAQIAGTEAVYREVLRHRPAGGPWT